MGLVFILIEMDINIMDNGKMIKSMEKVFYIIQMVKFMREILKMENLMDWGYFIIIMEINLLVISGKIQGKDME